MKNQNTPIAFEGFPFIAGFASVSFLTALVAGKLCSAALYGVSLLFALLTLFSLFFFRNPRRTPPADERAVLAPADGTVIVVDRVPVTPLGVEALKISIFMSVFNVHINRVPLSGRVVELVHTPGAFFDVRDGRSSCENERSTMILETASGLRMAVVQVAGLIARRIVCYARQGDLLERGRRYGLIRFGSRLDLYLPPHVQSLVKPGDKTVGGETVLARLEQGEV